MARRDLHVPVRYYLRLAEVLVRYGVDVDKALHDLDLASNLMTEADATLKFSQVEKLIEHFNQLSGRGDLGYDLGKLLSVSTHSIVGFGMLSSPNVERALNFVARYFRLVMPSFRLRYKSGAEFGELHFTPTVAMGRECLAFHLEALGMATLRDVQDLTGGRAPPCRLYLSIPQPPHAKRYRELRGVEPSSEPSPCPGCGCALRRTCAHIR